MDEAKELSAIDLRLLDGLEISVKSGGTEPEAGLVTIGCADSRERVREEVVRADEAMLHDEGSVPIVGRGLELIVRNDLLDGGETVGIGPRDAGLLLR